MQEAVPEGKGLMAAILGLEREGVDRICSALKSGYASPANYNCPGQIVIAGEKGAVEEAIELCKQAGAIRAVPLSVSVPSHCKLMSDASKRLEGLLDTIRFKPPMIVDGSSTPLSTSPSPSARRAQCQPQGRAPLAVSACV